MNKQVKRNQKRLVRFNKITPDTIQVNMNINIKDLYKQ